LLRKEGLKPMPVRRKVQESAHKHLGPIRTQGELSEFVAFLDRLTKDELPNLATTSKSRTYNKEWIDAIEIKNMVHLLKAAAASAISRTESRGVHYREDFPYTDNDNWLGENIVQFDAGAMKVSRRPVSITSLMPPKGKVPFLDMMKKMMQSRSDIGGHH